MCKEQFELVKAYQNMGTILKYTTDTKQKIDAQISTIKDRVFLDISHVLKHYPDLKTIEYEHYKQIEKHKNSIYNNAFLTRVEPSQIEAELIRRDLNRMLKSDLITWTSNMKSLQYQKLKTITNLLELNGMFDYVKPISTSTFETHGKEIQKNIDDINIANNTYIRQDVQCITDVKHVIEATRQVFKRLVGADLIRKQTGKKRQCTYYLKENAIIKNLVEKSDWFTSKEPTKLAKSEDCSKHDDMFNFLKRHIQKYEHDNKPFKKHKNV